MCGNCNDPFHGLEDDLDDVFAPADDDQPKRPLPTLKEAQQAVGLGYTEKCRQCNGRGRFISYAGRDCGPCFACKGKGTKTFKTSPQAREKARVANARKADEKRVQIQESVQAWQRDNADDFAWIMSKRESFDFANSMADALTTYGSLTERQHATVTRLRLADIERQAQRAREAAARQANAPAVNIEAIEKAFATAQEKGIKRPKMRLAGFKFSLAPAHGRNAGALYVVRVEDDQYLGKIAGGRFVRVRECDDATESQIVEVASDPHNAAIAYGQRTGSCAICGRELTNHASIDLGIGPICASKYGWA